MREFLLKIFSREIGGPDITLFGVFHILYFLIIMGLTVFGCIRTFNKSKDEKKKTLDIMALCLVILYLGDFFVHPFIDGENALIVDKLPFHICTLSCVLIAITRVFTKHTKHIQQAVPVLGLIGALMYITCPSGAVGPGVKAFSYVMLQTFTYHGLLFAYGVMSLTTGEDKLDYKKIYVEAIIIVVLIFVALGANAAYSTETHHYDWFFVTGSSFGMNKYLMPFIMFAIIFAMTNAIYLIYFGIRKLLIKKNILKTE